MKRWVKLVVAWLFMLLGVAGLFLPVLQGVLFLAIGMTLLASEYQWARRLLDRARARFPALARTLDRVKDRLDRR